MGKWKDREDDHSPEVKFLLKKVKLEEVLPKARDAVDLFFLNVKAKPSQGIINDNNFCWFLIFSVVYCLFVVCLLACLFVCFVVCLFCLCIIPLVDCLKYSFRRWCSGDHFT
jgi:hypothetical protein